jgi:hypothetical protein
MNPDQLRSAQLTAHVSKSSTFSARKKQIISASFRLETKSHSTFDLCYCFYVKTTSFHTAATKPEVDIPKL